MRKRELLKRIDGALDKIKREIANNARGGKYGAGLSSEGYAGGYRDALISVKALLQHGYPNDDRRYWTDGKE